MRLKAFHAAGVYSLRDLLYISPVRYQDQRKVTTVRDAADGEKVCLRLIRRGVPTGSYHGHLNRVTCRFADETGEITACWFNQPWMMKQCEHMEQVVLYGTVKSFSKARSFPDAAFRISCISSVLSTASPQFSFYLRRDFVNVLQRFCLNELFAEKSAVRHAF